MKKLKLIVLSMPLILLLSNCSKDNSAPIDTVYPEINVSATDGFPKQCSSIKRGETFVFKVLVSDNEELGSLSVNIHHNFDHHSHSTEVNDCDMEAVKTAVKPFLLVEDYSIPMGKKVFETAYEINVPTTIDAGDYHFLIRLTDKAGWQTIKGLSIKII